MDPGWIAEGNPQADPTQVVSPSKIMEYALFLIHIVSYDLDVTPLLRVLKQEMPGYEAAFVLRNRYRGNVKHSAALSSSLS